MINEFYFEKERKKESFCKKKKFLRKIFFEISEFFYFKITKLYF
jgi:hypothetical protein